MTRDTKRLLLGILSFIIPLVGFVLYFVYTPKKDAKLFGLIALIAVVLYVVWRVL